MMKYFFFFLLLLLLLFAQIKMKMGGIPVSHLFACVRLSRGEEKIFPHFPPETQKYNCILDFF